MQATAALQAAAYYHAAAILNAAAAQYAARVPVHHHVAHHHVAAVPHAVALPAPVPVAVPVAQQVWSRLLNKCIFLRAPKVNNLEVEYLVTRPGIICVEDALFLMTFPPASICSRVISVELFVYKTYCPTYLVT